MTAQIEITYGPRHFVRQLGQDNFSVIGPNEEPCSSYSGAHLTICYTDGRDDAAMIARALNAMKG